MIEFNLTMLSGLAMLLLTVVILWCIAWCVLGFLRRRSKDKTWRKSIQKTQRHVNRACLPVTGVVVLSWVLAVVWTGWQAPSSEDDPAGDIVSPYTRMVSKPSENNPRSARQRLRENGQTLQEDSSKRLDDFRSTFLSDKEK